MQMKTGVEQAAYALLILAVLPDRTVLAGEAISSRLGASPTYFQKLLRKLVHAGLITSTPGAKGGFRLDRQPHEIQIFDVFMAVEGQQSLYSSTGLLNDLLVHEEEPKSCLLTEVMTEAEETWKTALKRETIASLKEQISTDYPHTFAELQEWARQNSANGQVHNRDVEK